MSMFVPDLSNEPALTMVRMHNDLTRQVLVIRVIMINTILYTRLAVLLFCSSKKISI